MKRSALAKICFRAGTSLLLLLVFRVSEGFSQEIQINEDPRIAQLYRNWTNANRAEPQVEGWRIQLMSTTDRQQAEDARNRFRSQYPEVPAEWIHEKPYYKLRAGAFRTKLEALAFLGALSAYVGAYPARDTRIHPRDFLEQ